MNVNQLFIGQSSGGLKVLYDIEKTNSEVGIVKAVQKVLKRKNQYEGNLGSFYDAANIMEPVEIMDRKQREYEANNPEAAKSMKNQDKFPFSSFLKPEVYEEELELRR